MKLRSGQFELKYADDTADASILEKDGLVVGRLKSCDVVLNHKAVSRIHAGINCIENEYYLINLSISNSLTLNGKLLVSQDTDVLADGDIIQIGPFAINVSRNKTKLSLTVSHHFAGGIQTTTGRLPSLDKIIIPKEKEEISDVLKVFWEKRTREKDEWGTSLRPKGSSLPGKALINWKPTGDLKRKWRFGVFVWAFLILGCLAAFAFFQFPNTFAPKPLSNPHGQSMSSNMIANRGNESSCTTCHAWNQPMETSCTTCHQADQFHASNAKYHADAGVSCTVCHKEHMGAEFDSRKFAFDSCSTCHNDNNKTTYNGKTVRTAHDGTFGYPVEKGKWTWKGMHPEIAETMLDQTKKQTQGREGKPTANEQFHAVHTYQLSIDGMMKDDGKGTISCTSCHKSFNPIDRETPKQSCGVCHNGMKDQQTGKVLVEKDKANCVSCHAQHPYSTRRWNEFLNESAVKKRNTAVSTQIKRLNGN